LEQKFTLTTLDEWIFTDAYAEETLLKHFQTISLKGFGVGRSEKRNYCGRRGDALPERHRTSQPAAYNKHAAHQS
jgi:hypothetical protein